MKVRTAEAADGPAIEALLREDGQHIEGVDYSDVSGYWLVGERDGEIISCCQIVPSRPIAHAAFFVVAEKYRRGPVTWNMLAMLLETLRGMGSTHLMWFVYRNDANWKSTIERHGSVKITGKGSMYVRSTETLVPSPRMELLEIT